MRKKLYLAVNSRGSAKVTQKRPALNYDEIEIGLELNIPDALFDKPRLNAVVMVPKEAVCAPDIEVNIADNIAEAVKTATGMEVHITMVRPESDSITQE